MTRCPKEYRLTQEETDNLNRPKPPKAIEFVLKTFLQKKKGRKETASWPGCFISTFYQTLRGKISPTPQLIWVRKK